MSAWQQRRRCANSAYRTHRASGNPAIIAGLLLLSLLTILLVSPALADTSEARQDSLRSAIKTRLHRIEAMRDSLREEKHTTENAQSALRGIESVISELKNELAELDITVNEDMVLFRNPSGDIRIDFPADWNQKVSQGLGTIAATILAELPDTLDLQGEISRLQDQARHFNWDIFNSEDQEPERRVISNDLFSTGNDVVVEADERVTGNVIVLGADAAILGEVDGQIVVVGGTLTLAEDAIAHKDAIVIIGQLRRDNAAEIEGSAVGESEYGFDNGWATLSSGPIAGMIKLTSYVVLFFLIILLFAVTPRDRIESMYVAMMRRPGRAVVSGLLWVLVGHIVLIILVAVLAATVIGIPLALLFGLAYVLMGLLATGLVGRRIGRLHCRNLCPDKLDSSRPLLLGLVVLFLPGLLGAAFSAAPSLTLLGHLFDLSAGALLLGSYCFGTGALFNSRFGNNKIRTTE